MIFNEIYGCYYNAVAKIIGLAIDGELTESKMNKIIRDLTYEESNLIIVPALKSQQWQLIDHEFETPILNKPSMPLTLLERRWLKTILMDERVKLFQIPEDTMENVEPLYDMKDIVYFDRYEDGDNYSDPLYIEHFHTIMKAIQERRAIQIRFISGRGRERKGTYNPVKIEYSDKEDKFRVICIGERNIHTLNIGRIIECKITEEHYSNDLTIPEIKMERLIFELRDERNTLERVLMKFAHYKKEVERIEDNRYLVKLEYDLEEQTDILIQIMNFGGFVHILEPVGIKTEMKKRIERQLDMLDW